jgi:hypothetical protein
MALLLYIFSYFFADDDESSVVGMKMPRFHDYDYRDLLPKTTVYWDEKCRVVSADDLNLFDESTTPPLQMYTGHVKPILKRKSSETLTEKSSETLTEKSSEVFAVNADEIKPEP